jgi:hypothetical protein
MSVSWEAVTAVSSVAGTVLVVVVSWVALRQVRESLAGRQMQAALAFMERLQGGSVRNIRRFLTRHAAEIDSILKEPERLDRLDHFLRTTGPAARGPASLSDLHHDLGDLEFAAVLGMHSAVPPDLERAYLAPMIVHYWRAAAPVVHAIRADGGLPMYLQHTEAFADLHQRRHTGERRARRAKHNALRRLTERNQAEMAALNWRVPVSDENSDAE